MSWMRATRYVVLGLALSYGFPAACGSGGVVGGKCRSGYTSCAGECVDLQTDIESCGACSLQCDDELACVRGLCGGEDGGITLPIGGAPSNGGASNQAGHDSGGSPQGQAGEASNGGSSNASAGEAGISGQPGQGGAGQAGAGQAGAGQAGADHGGAGGEGGAPIACVPPHNVPSHCGDCETQCRPPTPFCAPDGGDSFECVPMCELPLIECSGRCLDPEIFNSDPENCGECGNVCPSGICQGGECFGAKYGNQVLLCMNFANVTQVSAPTTLLGNALFLLPSNPINVLAYTDGASPAAVAKVNQVIGWAASARGRSVQITAATSASQVTSLLNVMDYSVMLIHDLPDAAPGEPAAAGAAWSSGSVLSSFSRAGGTVIVLDGGGGTAEMHELISSANLLNVSGQIDISGDQIWNQAPFDAVGINVLSPFLGTTRTCSFQTSEVPDATTLFVLSTAVAGGNPVAIHRVIAP